LKLFIACSTIDLRYRLGCTPSWWQLFKALHETGNDVIITPYLGDPVESLWWRTYPNPCSPESILYNWFLDLKKRNKKLFQYNSQKKSCLNRFTDNYILKKWKNHILSILQIEKDVDAVLFMNVPLNHIKGIATSISTEFSIPVGYYDGDMPTILPQYAVDRGFKFNYYVDADLSEYDIFYTNSKGVIPDLIKMGARNVHPLYYAADPDLFRPIEIEKDIDISFFGYGNEFREEWMDRMITKPSLMMNDTRFCVAGGGFTMDLGKAEMMGDLSFNEYRNFICRSKICLNITRWSHTSVYGSSTARPFELAAFGACILSQPYSGIEEWFEPGRDIVVIDEEKESGTEILEYILSNNDLMIKFGKRVRKKIETYHTYIKRALFILNQFERCK